MIFIFIAALLSFGDCTDGGAVSGYGDFKDLLDGLKTGAYGVQQYEQTGYSKSDGYLEDSRGFKVRDDNSDGNYGKNDVQWGYEEYVYNKNHYNDFDIRKYDYVQKCDINVKDCKDGRDCYDKASDRSGYDSCKNQYGEEGRYYDIDDRYTGNRYREYDFDDRYDKECYDYNKNRDDFNKCQRYYRKCRRDYRRGSRYSYDEKDWRNDRNCDNDDQNLVGLGRRDRDDQLIRPCALDDRQCIRKYLAKNSDCKPVYGPIPDPLYLKKSTFYFPFANLTVIRTRLRVTGLASIKISEFYVNKDTKNLVIALAFERLNQTSPRIYFRYKRTAKESIVLADYASVEHKSGTFTAVIPKIPHLRLDLAEIHADIDDPLPRIILGPKAVDSKETGTFTAVIPKIPHLRLDLTEIHEDIDDAIPIVFIGPKAIDSKDPDVIASVAKLFSNLSTASQDFFLFTIQL